jgi:hypothetical protein
MADAGRKSLEPSEIERELSRIGAAVEAGDTDFSHLGFWRVVARVKRDPLLAERHAEAIGRIDAEAFRRRFRIRVPVWAGNSTLVVGTLATAFLVPVSWFSAGGGESSSEPVSTPAGFLILVAAGGLSVTLHDLAHWLVGRVVGIRFLAYFLDGPFRIKPGLKSDYATYVRASPNGRAAMHAAGAVASKIAPFAVLLAAWLPDRGLEGYPGWSIAAVAALGVTQVVTDLAWSRRKGDWKRYARERRAARAG